MGRRHSIVPLTRASAALALTSSTPGLGLPFSVHRPVARVLANRPAQAELSRSRSPAPVASVIATAERYLTTSVPYIPATRWPGAWQKNV